MTILDVGVGPNDPNEELWLWCLVKDTIEDWQTIEHTGCSKLIKYFGNWNVEEWEFDIHNMDWSDRKMGFDYLFYTAIETALLNLEAVHPIDIRKYCDMCYSYNEERELSNYE